MNGVKDAGKQPTVNTRLSVLITLIGFALMAGKIYADGEPGGIPILLVVLGIGWYLACSWQRHIVDSRS